MKKILLLMTMVLLLTAEGFSQAPGILNYQGVARNSVGNVLVNQNISLRLTIRNLTAAGAVVYQESRAVTTNPFGLFNVQLGSPGASGVSGTIAGVNWAVGDKYIQVEIDPNGGSSFINIGTAQLASVPYSLFATTAGDLILPFNKTQNDNGTLFKITNSGTNSGSTALEGLTNSTAGNANAIIGTVTSTAPGGFSAGVRGINNGTAGLGIGVYGSQAGSGWGVYGITPTGIGVNGASTSGTGVFGLSTSGTGVYGTSSTGNGGLFEVTNSASTADALRATTAGTGASWAIRGISSGSNGAGLFQQTNATNTSNNLQSNQAGLGRAGLFNSTNAASTANAVDINVAGTGYGLRIASTNGAPRALQTVGALQLTGINEGANRLLTSDAAGNATWQNAAVVGVVTGSGTLNFVPKWTPNGTNLGNSLLFDNGTSMGVGTVTPTHRFDVTHGGSTGIGVNSTAGFSVVDINAASGDAALRFGNAGINQWNIRNQPGTNNFEFFEFGGGGQRMIIEDATGNIGISQSAPTHRLHVTHGGSTGILSQSTSSFSVVDIDAANGDAALRFQRAGAGQWNTRNRPGDDYYEIFELGGGGSRLVIQDGTGNVGIGATVSPSYKLDVEHAGSTGIRSKSTGSFSVVDIDGASGDAALRFQNAGVGQWNTRNRPGDDYYEIFELGGGGSRVVIQDGTGNVGIGETVSPSYKLDVLHGGATGIRSRSSGTFSVIDIDAANGDAALRFAKAGVNQWNTRNRPADDYYEIFELGGGGSRVVIQDGTGNVGIGETVNPTYKLDVLHGGSTGIRSRSSGSFSVVDIDGASGDAALRFANAGVNQWNMRNEPGTDNLQIFELGGGGERMSIQNGSGNVAIGGSTGSYRLDVLHGGATGLRVQSSSTFSIIDIDGSNGDAALRFARAGVNQWNTRNNPGTDDYQIFELGGGGERMRIENTTGTVVVNGDFTVVGAKAFTMDHPLDPANKLLRHAAAESNEVINFYSGNVTTDASGKAIVTLPDYYEALNKDSRYQLTVIGSFAQAIISKEVSNNKFEIATSIPNVKVSWEVKGVRNDARMKQHPFVAEEIKTGAQKGKYWDPASHNQPESMSVSYDKSIESSLNSTPKETNKVASATSGGSLDQPKVVPPSAKSTDNSGSVENTPVAKPTNKVADKSGSVEDVPAVKKEAKPTPATKGGSLDEMPKPVENKKVVVDPGSTKTE